ncbi:MAG: hypothetical protein AAF208_09780 [Cyanobacteria bacterium P01_A01_bin.45]
MTSRVTEIQTLIADIDGLLVNKGKRLNKILSQGQEARQILEKLRGFLSNLESETALGNSSVEQQSSPLLARFLNQGSSSTPGEVDNAVCETQEEIQALLDRKAKLSQEVTELENQRLQSYSLKQQVANQEQMISEFLQVLLSRVRNGLPSDITQNNQQNIGNNPSQPLLTSGPKQEEKLVDLQQNQVGLSNSLDQLQHLNRLTSDLDRRLLALDGTVNAVFEALESNVNTYNESLSAAIARMHSQGIQSEELLNNFVNGLRERFLRTGETDAVTQTVFSDTKKLSSSARDLVPVEPVSIASAFGDGGSEFANQENFTSVVDDYQATDAEVLGEGVAIPDLDVEYLDFDQVTSKSSDLSSKDEVQNESHGNSDRDQIEELYASLFDNVEPTITPLAVNSEDQVVEELLNELDENNQKEPDSDQEPEEYQKLLKSDITAQVEIAPLADVRDNTVAPSIGGGDSNIHDNSINIESDQAQLNSEEGNNLPDPWVAVDDTSKDSSDSETFNPENLNSEEGDIPDWNTFSVDQEVQESHNRENPEVLHQDSVSARYDIFASETFDFTTDYTPESIQEITPDSGDTVTLLTDLLDKPIDKSSKNLVPNIEKDTTQLSETTQAEINSDTPQISPEEYSQEEYISACASENLLDEDPKTEETIAKVTLNQEQERQLTSDLVNLQDNKPQTEESQIQQTFPRVEIADNQEKTSQQEVANTQLDLSPVTDLISEDENNKASTPQESTTPVRSQIIGTTVTSINPLDSVWYLGIDIGTTGICAVLFNRSTQDVYPLYWQTNDRSQADKISSSFRLPAEVYLPTAAVGQKGTLNQELQQQISPVSTAEEENAPKNAAKPETSESSPSTFSNNLFSAKLKPYLNIALPYRSISGYVGEEAKHKWEPLLQMNELSVVPLVWVVRSLSKLLLTLKSDHQSTTLSLTAAADGLNTADFEQIIDNLAGVICNCPSNWTEQYRFNIREALLTSKLVQHPQQVFFVEEAIASLISELDGAAEEKVSFGGKIGINYIKTNEHQFLGSTLVVNIGAGSTEMTLVDIPEYLHELTHDDFMLHNFAYAGIGIEQDIVSQLLVSEKWRSLRSSSSENQTSNSNVKPWRWRSSGSNLEKMRLSSLGLDNLELPKPGEPDTAVRILLQRRLESSVLGQALLDAAGALKLILQQQESFTIELADQRWTLNRRDLEAQVFVPFVRRLNREINRLLVAKGIPTEAINQAILTGGVSGLGAVNRWLRQKLPNAKIIQDIHPNQSNIPQCTRVAYGLALLPLHPQVLEIPRQQYTDYFLFTELLRLLPSRTVSFGEIIQLFEERGINTRSCQERLLAFLEGKIPSGLIPTDSPESKWMTRGSLENSEYKSIQSAPMFEKQGSVSYRPNTKQLEYLRNYLHAIQLSTQQSLEEPYTVNFAVSTVKS